MSGPTKIAWTKKTWNPVAGCKKVSPGCLNCYATSYPRRFEKNPKGNLIREYRGIVRKLPNGKLDWTGKIRELPDRLGDPLAWREPQRIFVNSLSDLFHEDLRLEFIQRVFDVMRRAYWHHFQVLTKRSERLLELSPKIDWPENVWMGVSVEDAVRTVRIDHLRRTGAKVKWISVEPLLGPLGKVNLRGIDWVVIGGESGLGARPMDVAWARDVRDQCRVAKVAIFMKQLGAVWAKAEHAGSKKGGEPSEWPRDLRIREHPRALPKHK